MTKWLILEQEFLTTQVIVEKGFLNEEEAKELCDKWNKESDIWTSYTTQAYQEETLLNFNGKLKIK
jgi:hypothetical protein